MICAATSSCAALRSRPRTPAATSADPAARVVSRSSTRVDRQAEAALELAREALGARGHLVRGAVRVQRPADDQPLRPPFAISAAMAAKRAAAASAAIVVSGCARRDASCCPPRRRSSACRNRRPAPCRLGRRRLQAGQGQACPTSSDRREKSMPSSRIAAGRRSSGGMSNSDVRVGRDGQPGVLRDLVLELPRRPAGVAQRDQHVASALARGRPPRGCPSTW